MTSGNSEQQSSLDKARSYLIRAERAIDTGCQDAAGSLAAIGAGFAVLAQVEAGASTGVGPVVQLPVAVDPVLARQVVERVRQAAEEARPHDGELIHPLDKACSRGAFLRLECDLPLDGASVLSLHKVGSDVHLRVWHAGSEQYAVAVLDRAHRRDVVHALTEFDTSEADRG